jgi:hypothetical protein
MLRAYVIQYDKHWNKCLALAEFSYNNSYQSSIKMAPFEALYGHQCRTPLNWSQTGEREIFGPDLVNEAEEKVRIIRNNLKATQSRQKSYTDKRRKPIQFGAGCEVLKLKAELLQEQEEEGGDRRHEPAHGVRGEEDELPRGQVVDGDFASPDPPDELRRGPSQKVAHQVQLDLALEAAGLTKRRHGDGRCCGRTNLNYTGSSTRVHS